MTKKELMESLANMYVNIIVTKDFLQDKINDCFDEYSVIINPSGYDELIKKYEFYNGQHALINEQTNLFKINQQLFNELVHELYMNYKKSA